MRKRPSPNRGSFRVFATVLAVVQFGVSGEVSAQSIARAMKSGPAYLCPKSSCPQASRGAPRAGSGVAVFEINGGFARITGYMDAATARTKYGLTGLTQGGNPVALWIPVDRLALAPSVAKKVEAEKKAEEERLKREAAKKKAAERRRKKLAEEKRKAEESAKTAKASGEAAPKTKTASDNGVKAESAGRKAAADNAKAKTQTEAEVVKKPAEVTAKAEAKPATPKRLTAKLKDKRLSSLPSKAGPTLSMADVVEIRQKGLELLEAGECESLKAGGVASTAGFLFVQCGGISAGSGFTQFPRPQQ